MISFKLIVLIVIGGAVLYYANEFANPTEQSNTTQNKVKTNINIPKQITCKAGETIVNGACVKVSPCGILPLSITGCNTTNPKDFICDTQLNNQWRCPLPCERPTNPLPRTLGGCSKTQIKCSPSGTYYCPNDPLACAGKGDFYGSTIGCQCKEGFNGRACNITCASGMFYSESKGTCQATLTCENGGVFDAARGRCNCTGGYLGKTCSVNANSCHGNGMPIIRSDGKFMGCTGCNANSTGMYCCPTGQKYIYNPCTHKSQPICTESPVNGGWVYEYKTCPEITTGNWIAYQNGRDDGSCLDAAGIPREEALNRQVTLRCTMTENNTVPKITGSYGCPENYTCADCGSTAERKPPMILNASGNIVYNAPRVCVCDSTTDHRPTCRSLQYAGGCGSGRYPDLCGSGATPNCLECNPRQGFFMLHCPGFVPVNVPEYGASYADNLKQCFENAYNIQMDELERYYVDGSQHDTYRDRYAPIFPTIDNVNCKSLQFSTSMMNKIGGSLTQYYSLWDNPIANVMEDGSLVYRVGSSNNLKYDTGKYMLYDGEFVTTAGTTNIMIYSDGKPRAKPLASMRSASTSAADTVPGCFKRLTDDNGKSLFCDNEGTFDQTILNSSTEAGKTHGLDHGKCSCKEYTSNSIQAPKDGNRRLQTKYAGNKCQYDDNTHCSGHGIVKSDTTGLAYNFGDNISGYQHNYTCACDPGYAGNYCQFSNMTQCNNLGTVSSVTTGKKTDRYGNVIRESSTPSGPLGSTLAPTVNLADNYTCACLGSYPNYDRNCVPQLVNLTKTANDNVTTRFKSFNGQFGIKFYNSERRDAKGPGFSASGFYIEDLDTKQMSHGPFLHIPTHAEVKQTIYPAVTSLVAFINEAGNEFGIVKNEVKQNAANNIWLARKKLTADEARLKRSTFKVYISDTGKLSYKGANAADDTQTVTGVFDPPELHPFGAITHIIKDGTLELTCGGGISSEAIEGYKASTQCEDCITDGYDKTRGCRLCIQNRGSGTAYGNHDGSSFAKSCAYKWDTRYRITNDCYWGNSSCDLDDKITSITGRGKYHHDGKYGGIDQTQFTAGWDKVQRPNNLKGHCNTSFNYSCKCTAGHDTLLCGVTGWFKDDEPNQECSDNWRDGSTYKCRTGH